MPQTTRKKLSIIRKGEEEFMTEHIPTVVPNYFLSGMHDSNVRRIQKNTNIDYFFIER